MANLVNYKSIAKLVYQRVFPDANMECAGFELEGLETEFRKVGDPEKIKAATVAFLKEGQFPDSGPFTPLYKRLHTRKLQS